jgi:hypothetical protein
VVRPGRPPCGDRPALSWDCAALRGHRPDLAPADMGSARPARRFDALRALSRPDLPSRLSPDGGPPCAFASLQRSIAAPPHRPACPKARMADDASSPGLRRLTTHAGTADPFARRAPGPTPCRVRGYDPPSRRPPPSLRAPCGTRASTGFALQGVLLAPIGPPFGGHGPLGVRRVGSQAPLGSLRTRSSSGLRSRCELVPAATSLRTQRVDAFLGFTPSERSLLPSWRALLVHARSPTTRWAE